MIEYFKFKNALKVNDVRFFTPNLLAVLAYVVDFCNHRKIPCIITSGIRSIEENRAVGAKSMTHVEGRAFDISVKGFSVDEIDDLVIECNSRFASIAAISSETGLPVCARFKNNGHGDHIHFQVKRG
jgi:hypothetical protein